MYWLVEFKGGERMSYIRKVRGIDCLFMEGACATPTKKYPYYYEARHSDKDWTTPSTIEDSVVVNFWGSVLACKPLPVRGYLPIRKAKSQEVL